MAKRSTRALRTKSGKPSATARRRFGAAKSSPNRTGSFPVFDQQSARSALRLRGKARSKKAVLNKVAAYASKAHSAPLKAAVQRARAVDRKR